MKNLLLILLCCWSLNLFSQEYFEGRLTYKKSISYKTKKDSIKDTEFCKDKPDEFFEIMRRNKKEVYEVKKDSVLLFEYLKEVAPPHYIYFSTSKELKWIRLKSGKTISLKDYTKKKLLNLKNYKRLEQEDQSILGKECTAWFIKTKRFWKKIWVADMEEKFSKTIGSRIFIDNKLIMKEIVAYSIGTIFTKEITKIEGPQIQSFTQLIKEHTNSDIKNKYQAIPENEMYANQPIKVGEYVPDLYYKNIYKKELGHINELTHKSKYTIIELWGTWCLPCLMATQKIKELRDQYPEDYLSILSLNTNDKQEKKVKAVIEKKQMNWNHAYSTKKLVTILNPKKRFPCLLVINNENKVLFIGNPNTEYEKIKEVLR